jgi:hypothetical protein
MILRIRSGSGQTRLGAAHGRFYGQTRKPFEGVLAVDPHDEIIRTGEDSMESSTVSPELNEVHRPRVLTKLQARQMLWALSVRHFVPRQEAPDNAMALGAGRQIARRPHTSHRGTHTGRVPTSIPQAQLQAARNLCACNLGDERRDSRRHNQTPRHENS